MESVTFVWPEWSVESVESETANSVVYRARRVEFGETLYAAIKITKVPVEAGQNRAEVRRRIDEWCAQMAGLRQISSLLVPEDIRVEAAVYLNHPDERAVVQEVRLETGDTAILLDLN